MEDSPGDEATDVVIMGTIFRNWVMKKKREKEKYMRRKLVDFLFFFLM